MPEKHARTHTPGNRDTSWLAGARTYKPHVRDLISSLRGFEAPESRATDRGTKGLDSVIEACIERYQIGKDTPEETIARNWRSIVGEQFAHLCAPERIDNTDTLLIKAPGAVARRELVFREARIMTALRSLPGCGHIRGIAFRAG